MTRQFTVAAILVAAFAVLASSGAEARRLRIAPGSVVRDDPPKCDRCTDAVATIRDTLTNPNTTAQVKQTLALICELKPDEQTRKQCEQKLDAEIDQVVANLTATFAHPLAFCQKYNLCEYEICNSCVEGVNTISAQLFGPGGVEEKMKTAAENYFCRNLPDFLKKACKRQIDNAVNGLLSKIQQKLSNPQEVCEELKVCNQTEALTFRSVQAKSTSVEADFIAEYIAEHNAKEDVPCAMCTGIGLGIFIALQEGKTPAEIEARLTMVCQKLPVEELRTACKNFLDQNLDRFIPAVKQSDGDITKACQSINLCMDDDNEEQIVVASVNKIMSANVGDGVPCAFCEGVGLAIYIALMEGKTPQQITQRLEIICSRLPGKLQTVCKKFVDVDLAVFIPLIRASNGNIRGACRRIDMCLP